MRHFSISAAAVVTALVLSACSGGSGGSTPSSGGSQGTGGSPSGPSSSNQLVAPTFTFVVPKSPTTQSAGRSPDFISSATGSVTITLTNPPPGLTPTSVTSQVSGTTCTAANPCVVSGPPSPPGVADTFLVQTFASTNGTGAVLDTGTVTTTPTVGQSNSTTIVLQGVPSTITITNVPTTFAAGTANQTQALTVTVKDASGVTITGTYANPVIVSSADNNGTPGTRITGTAPAAGCAANTTCAQLATNTDTATLAYGGLAEPPVTLTGAATGATSGTATFTPVLGTITHSAGPTSQAAGNPFGIDLFTNNPASTVGYSGTESYTEAGFTGTYGKTLTATPAGAGCGAFATIATAADAGTGATDFTATSIAAPAAGTCTVTVGDGVAGHATASFVVTYTTSGLSANAKTRK